MLVFRKPVLKAVLTEVDGNANVPDVPESSRIKYATVVS